MYAYPLLEDFTEGNARSTTLTDIFGRTIRDARDDGAGVTWNCAVDQNIANARADCSERWQGGAIGSATALPVVHTGGMTGEVEWDVTADVLADTTAWLIKAEQPFLGVLNYHARESSPAPTLVLER
jgi:hypothetical protein